MSGIGTGYDLSASTYSPDGRIFQVEYAGKAVENSGTALGLRCKDGVVLAIEKLIHSKLLTPGQNRRIQSVDLHAGIATAGLLADGKHIINRGKDEAANYRDVYRQPVPGKILAERLGQYVQTHTLYSSVRPFGSTVMLATMDSYDGPQLFMIDPSGVYWGYHGCAAGKGRSVAKTEIEKLDLKNLTAREAVKEAAKILHSAHDESKDRDYELEISWVCTESGMKHQFVPKDLLAEAKAYAEASTRDEMQD